MKQITLLGSTGSIGENTLNVISQHPDLYKVFALSANQSIDKLFNQCVRFLPKYAVVADPEYVKPLRDKIQAHDLSTVVLGGSEGLCMIAEHPQVDKVVAGIVGAAGLTSTLSAVRAGKEVLLANKESLVMAGDHFMQIAKKTNANILPLDSEHNAIFQCMPAHYRTGTVAKEISRLILTASGGPFLHFTDAQLKYVTPEMACNHPNWKMGKKISVDCATLMNKGLELIEAAYLFQCQLDQLEVVIHPQSIVHSLVEYLDGSLLAQLGSPDMRIPIAHALGWPERIESGAKKLSLHEIGTLTFCKPDLVRFPCLRLAMEAISLKRAAPVVLNASNEVAVLAFLNGTLSFKSIPVLIEKCLSKYYDKSVESLEAIIEVDRLARNEAMKNMMSLTC